MRHILLTGRPRSGKTTLLKQIIKDLKASSGGFYTEEIIKDNKRIGFKLITLDGKEGILAKEGLESKFRLGRYGINLKDLEEIGVRAIKEALKNKDVVIIDEIGKMELFSQKFKEVVLEALNSEKRIIGVVHRENRGFLKDIKSRPDIELFELNLENQKEILERINSMFKIS
ncbi:MAG: NTPase [Candidatus Omnitrophica bacterium]|nr:NTPase [Candidatus Omnitrophota bacterium]MCM8771241.1 NTPase [Candidatus Omnitrophota bacterium]